MAPNPSPINAHLRFVGILVLTGVMAGLVGAACHWILHTIEHVVWGKGGLAEHTLIEGAIYTQPTFRLAMLVLAGVVAAASWSLIVGTGAIPKISQAMGGGVMPVGRTVWHALTQIVIVALGASAGREAAPREITSAMGSHIGRYFGLPTRDRQIVVACAAGAGLAAVYAIPFSGFLFTVEVMLLTRRPRAVLASAIVNAVAVLVASGGDLSHAFYTIPPLGFSASLLVWACIAGPLLGAAGWGFRRGVRWAESRRPETLRVGWTLPLAFTGVGLLAALTPTVLGNGQAAAQTFFLADHYRLPGGFFHLGSLDLRAVEWLPFNLAPAFNSAAFLSLGGAIALVIGLAAAKALATLVTIRAGAWGGTLTPGLAVGSGVAAALALAWSEVWPGSSLASYVWVGAAAFLGVSLNAPLTGMFLVIEFTRSFSFSVYAVCAICALLAQVTARCLEARWAVRGRSGSSFSLPLRDRSDASKSTPPAQHLN